VFRSLWPGLFPKPFRKPLFDFPDVVIHAGETAVKKHPLYVAAKLGDEEAASELINDTLNPDAIEALETLLQGRRQGSFTPSTALLNQRLDTFSKPRMLNEYEIRLLRQSKKEIGEAVRKRFKEQAF
jgi:hypothetical protein